MLTEPGFEKAIDENPLEATNHLVYADWHDDQGQHDEAEFRRSLGNWLNGTGRKTKSNASDAQVGKRAGFVAGGELGFPEGILSDGGKHEYENFEHRTDTHGQPAEFNVMPERGGSHLPVGWMSSAWQNHDNWKSPYALRWLTYRGMEDALRRAFMNGRKKRMSRVAGAYKKHRRGA